MIKNLKITEENILCIYLDYVNNYKTLELFAKHNEISIFIAQILIDAGRKINNAR